MSCVVRVSYCPNSFFFVLAQFWLCFWPKYSCIEAGSIEGGDGLVHSIVF